MGLGSWLKKEASAAVDEAEDLGSSAWHTAEDVGSTAIDAGAAAVHEADHLAVEAEAGIVDTAHDAYGGAANLVTEEAKSLGGAAELGVEGISGIVPGLSEFERALIHGDTVVDEDSKAQDALNKVGEKTGLSDIYNAAADTKEIGDFVKIPSILQRATMGGAKFGAFIHDEL